MSEARKRVLVLWWSQSGQVRRAAESFAAPFAEAGHEVVHEELRPVRPFPFPWTIPTFFGAMPETVLERPRPIERVAAASEPWDLVVLVGQIWFLSPSQPTSALLLGPDRTIVQGRRVITVVSCRNMWVRGWRRTTKLVQAAGGVVTDRVIITHAGPAMASYFTTLFFVLTGRRRVIKALPAVEVAEESYRRLAEHGRAASTALATAAPGAPLLDPDTTASLSYPHAFGEQIGGALYGPISRVVAAVSSEGSALRGAISWVLLVIVLGLIFSLVIPCYTAWFLARPLLRPWLDRLGRLPVG